MVNYSTWVELFQTHCHAYNVLDHIDSIVSKPSDVSDDLWQVLEFVVKIWICGTISPSFVQTIIHNGVTAQQTWDCLN
ncbi:Virulence plasmid protein pGP6-D [Bienertia sinuspersici]